MALMGPGVSHSAPLLPPMPVQWAAMAQVLNPTLPSLRRACRQPTAPYQPQLPTAPHICHFTSATSLGQPHPLPRTCGVRAGAHPRAP